MAEPMWTPSDERVNNCQLKKFMDAVADRTGRAMESYPDLYDWSVSHVAEFWEAIWQEAKIVHSEPYRQVLFGDKMFKASFFDGARLNFAENLLRYRDDNPALIHWQEGAPPTRLTYKQLYKQVAACAHGLHALGVEKGDRVAGFLPNMPEAVIAMLAATSLGAVWSSCSPDFGFKGVLDRFGQIEPKVLFTADGYRYGGKEFDSLGIVSQIVSDVKSLEQIVVVPRIQDSPPRVSGKSVLWTHLVSSPNEEIVFEQVPFNHPVYIMYSSGTTGKPKCIVHGGGGTLLQHYKEHVLHTDLRRDDVLMYFTTCGWMMWNWLVSALQVGATIMLFDGSPGQDKFRALWRAVEEEKMTVFGTSPKYLSACESAGRKPKEEFELSSLRTILSTGAPLAGANFDWVYENVKEDLQVSSISGGTDIISCFALGNPMLPVYREQLQCCGLGMKVEVFNKTGRPVVDEVGELVCSAPFVSMPVSFWNDPNDELYHAAYFEHFDGVWRHGDYVKLTPRGGLIIYGRSDATLNPGGVRIGTAEIYGPVEAMDEIADSIVVAQHWNGDTRIVLFVVLNDGYQLTEDLKSRIKERIRQDATPRHIPAKILAVDAVPHTLNGKKVEIAVTKVIHGETVTNRDALANPESLDQFVGMEELTR